MEVLSTVEHIGEHVFILVFLSAVTLFFSSISVYGVVDSVKNMFDFNGFMGILICSIIAILTGIGVYVAYKDGVRVEYEVLITDFNEVYEQGYEIVDQRGDIYTVQKKED